MRNSFADYKILLDTLTYEEQINKINKKIYQLANEKQHSNIKDRRYELIKELKHMKNNVIDRSSCLLKKYIHIIMQI